MDKKTKVIALANQKGGCSKTTTSLNIAYSYSQKGKKVLLIDLDSQSSASMGVGIDSTDENINTIDELLGAYVRRDIEIITWDDLVHVIYTPRYLARRRIPNTSKWESVYEPFGFDIIPSSLNLSLVELQMSIAGGTHENHKIYSYYLYDLIECIKENADYDYIVIDTPPALGALSINAMTAAVDGIIIPSNLDIMSFRGIKSFKESAEYVIDASNAKGIKHRGIIGILLSLYAERRTVDKALQEYVYNYYPINLISSTIRESADAKRANLEGLLFAQINKKAKDDFDKLTNEIDFAIDHPEEWAVQAKEKYEQIKKEREENSEVSE